MTGWVRAGLFAAVFSGGPSTLLGIFRGDDLVKSTEAVGSLVLPGEASRWSRVGAGALVHLLISLLWARVMAGLFEDHLSGRRSAMEPVLVGALCGLGIAALDLGIIGRRLPAIRALPSGPQIADHLAYGALVGWTLRRRD